MSEPDQAEHPRLVLCLASRGRRRPAEEFLYVACLHEGTGVDEPDFLAVVDAEDGRIVHRTADAERRRRAASLRLEPLQLRLPRARTARI